MHLPEIGLATENAISCPIGCWSIKTDKYGYILQLVRVASHGSLDFYSKTV